MKRILLIALVLLAVALASAKAYELTRSCPYDGGKAYFAGTKITMDGTICHYQHTRWDSHENRTVTHSFWIPCND